MTSTLKERWNELEKSAEPFLERLGQDPKSRHRLEVFKSLVEITERLRYLFLDASPTEAVKLTSTEDTIAVAAAVVEAVVGAEAARLNGQPRQPSDHPDVEHALGPCLDAIAAIPADQVAGLAPLFEQLQQAADRHPALAGAGPVLRHLAREHQRLES